MPAMPMPAVTVVVATPHGRAQLRVLRAVTFPQRLRGLLGREALTRRYGLWIEPCRAVHTFGMRAAIDLVFVDRRGLVLRTDARQAPGRVRICTDARGVLELAAGNASRLGLDRPGARLVWPAADD